MRIELRVTGGIAGLAREAALDTGELGASDAQRLEAAVAALPAEPSAATASGARDVQHYELRVADRRWRFDDTTVPLEARPLLDVLTARLRPVTR